MASKKAGRHPRTTANLWQLTPRIEMVPARQPATMNNARTHSRIRLISCASLREFGFVNPILIDSDYGIIAGMGG